MRTYINNIDWFTSDLHVFHKNIIKYCNRPFKDIPDMHYVLIDNWNRVVQPKDRVLILGDFGFCGVASGKAILDKLNGYKILVLGNHDKNAGVAKRMGFDEVHQGVVMVSLFSQVYDDIKTVYACHFPKHPTLWTKIKHWFRSRKVRNKFFQRDKHWYRFPKISEKAWLVCGHSHEKGPRVNYKRKMVNVGVDQWAFKPVSVEELYEAMFKVKPN